MAFADDKIKVTEQAGTELFSPDKKAGTEVPAAIILQLAAIWARRAANDAAAVETELAALKAGMTALSGKLDVLIAAHEPPAAAR